MAQTKRLTAIIEREDDAYISLCPEFDIASQGLTIEEARDNLIDALALFFDATPSPEIAQRRRAEIYITHVDVHVA
jgi:predicted RNase H-like HicB family nuclease